MLPGTELMHLKVLVVLLRKQGAYRRCPAPCVPAGYMLLHDVLPVPGPERMWRVQIVKEKQEFDRVVVSREEALSMFEENKFKAEIINGLPQDATISLYRCGPMVRLSPLHALYPMCNDSLGS